MVVVVLIQELIPLQDPAAGWSANYGFWIRATVLLAVGVRTLTVQATYFIDGVQISTARQFLLSVSVSIVMTAFSVTLASHVIFPIPFFVVSTAPVMGTVHLVLFRIIVGSHIMHHMVTKHSQLAQYSNFVNAQAFMALVYPAYEALFRATEGSVYQLLVIPLLPVIKLTMKNIVLRCTSHLEDMTPEAVIFTVDLFNGIYMATCMQSSSSAFTVTAITLTDQVQTLIMLYGLHQRTNTALARLHDTVGASGESDNLLTALCLLCHDRDKFEKQTQKGVRKRSSLPNVLPTNDRGLLEMLDTISVKPSSVNVRQHITSHSCQNPRRQQNSASSSIFGELSRGCCRTSSRLIHPNTFVLTHELDSLKQIESRLPA
ncbi:unnamed protein product [Phytophthora lilii]|uniref:Unnamed protein product n=1 Tax=Phytophthora lilii TaxID=2077276 RepID=A0A9W7CHW7_9STRA|nr:unnamed protein product [Phytophthora lilii]